MEKLISTRCNIQSVPESYILPVEIRPGDLVVPLCKTIPVIDLQKLGHNQTQLIQQIIKASQEFGFFQLINHGVPEELMQDVLRVAKEFFELPAEDKARFYSEDPMQSCRLYTSIDYVHEKVHFWRDNLRHSCHPLDDHVEHWPRNPARYREVVGSYSVEVRKLSMRLLELIGEGLGLEWGYFFKEGLSQVQLMTLNHYPPCPDPSLVLGLPKHSDSNLITLLIQDEPGLQVLKDENWLALEPVPNSFVVNIGHMLQIISNGKLKSADHRVVTNARVGRTTVCSFIHPCGDTQIEPAQALLLLNKSKSNPPLYKAFLYKDFIPAYVADTYEGKPPLDRYKIHY